MERKTFQDKKKDSKKKQMLDCSGPFIAQLSAAFERPLFDDTEL